MIAISKNPPLTEVILQKAKLRLVLRLRMLLPYLSNVADSSIMISFEESVSERVFQGI
jgi:hypothetical protein